jgi:hypothetical protein
MRAAWPPSSAVARVGEQRIQAAIEAGELDGLPGLGQPIPGIDEPYDPLWWVKGWLRRLEQEHGALPTPHAVVAELRSSRG